MFAMVFLSGNYLRSLVWIIFLSGASLAHVVKQTEELNFGYNPSVVENESRDEDTVPVVKMFYIVIQVTNLARTDVLLFPNDRTDSILVKNNVIALIKMTTKQSTAVTFNVTDAKTKEPFYINGASSIGIVPKLIADTPEPLTITRSAANIKASTYYLEIQVINKTPRKIILIPDDNEPAQGFAIGPKTTSLITKTVRAKQPVIFKAIDAESDGELRINEQSSVSLVPTISKEHIESLTVTSESGDEDTAQPQIEPYYFWSFLTIINGMIPGHLPFNVLGHVEVVDGGLYFDGITAFLSTQLVPNNILANPGTAKEGLAFGIKMKFDGAAKKYDIPRYILDTGATSGGNTGVSLYVLNGKLIAEIATPVMKWKAEITLIYDQWFYIIVNWKSTCGLVIAFNGFPKSSDRKGTPVSGRQPSTKNPNFCLGRNVGGTGFYYTKFYLASLVVFKEYLSDSLIYPVYSYYRINAFKADAVSTEENEEAVAVEAPPVAARHSWIFTFILNGIIPGDVRLSVHGKTVAKEGATIFDGVTSWLGATLHSTDCLLAPANCRDGLSIGFKIRFTGLVNFPEERYIVDAGVLSKGTRGISIYLQDGQLFCAVMTMNAQWKLGMIVPRDRWIFIGISWSENQGLYLYNGGKLISQTKIKTPQNQVPISNASPNFVFGRSLAGTGFARFELASFSTFTTFLALSAMRPVFTYYWRIGLSRPTDGKTFIDIKISNRAGKDIVLMSSDKMPPKGLTIIKGVMLDFVKQFTGAKKVTFTAKDAMTGQLIYLNGKKSLTLEASSVRERKITIFATTKPGQISTD